MSPTPNQTRPRAVVFDLDALIESQGGSSSGLTPYKLQQIFREHPGKSLDEIAALYPQYPELKEQVEQANRLVENFLLGAERLLAPLRRWFEAIMNSPLAEAAMEIDEFLSAADIAEGDPILKDASLNELLQDARIRKKWEEKYNRGFFGVPSKTKRAPGRPVGERRLIAYHAIRADKMSHKQAFDWWLEKEGIKPFSNDDYHSRFKSFKNSYDHWKRKQKS